MERITRFRAIAMVLAFALILGLFGVRMYAVQMLDAGALVADTSAIRGNSTASTVNPWTSL